MHSLSEYKSLDYYAALQQAQQAYRKAGIYETFLALDLKQTLSEPQSIESITEHLDLDRGALSRFLHAAANLNLAEKRGEKFVAKKNSPSYSRESSLVLFWLFNSNLIDVLKNGAKSQEQLIRAWGGYDAEKLALAVKYNLIAQNHGGSYAIPASTSTYLLSGSPNYIGPRIKHFEKIMNPMFSVKGLLGALKTGKSQWETFFNKKVTHPFALYQDNPVLLDIFTNGLYQLNTDDDKVIVENLVIEDVKSVLDVGGGSGAFALQLLNNHYSIEHIDIYELPDAIRILKKTFSKYNPHESRINFISGSFFEKTKEGNLAGLPLTRQYDLIVLGWILHDWNDERNIHILKRILMHLKPNKILVILEALLPDSRISDVCYSDMAMLLQTEGRERTYSEYKQLLLHSGYTNISTMQTNTRRQAITATKPSIDGHI